MRVGPTLATGKHGWEMLIGKMAVGFPSQSPGKQDEKVAKPPGERQEETGTVNNDTVLQDCILSIWQTQRASSLHKIIHVCGKGETETQFFLQQK